MLSIQIDWLFYSNDYLFHLIIMKGIKNKYDDYARLDLKD
jgi:hypothetical protein